MGRLQTGSHAAMFSTTSPGATPMRSAHPLIPTVIAIVIGVTVSMAQNQNPAPPTQPATPAATRPAPPTRDPHTAGYVSATELRDGWVPPRDADGNFIIGPTHTPAPEMAARDE